MPPAIIYISDSLRSAALSGEKVWHPLAVTKPLIKMRHASGGCLSCSGKKDTKEPARGGTDREAFRCRCVLLPCTPASSRPPRDPVGTLDVLLAAEAASSPIGPCHSLRSLDLPQAALPSLPLWKPPGPSNGSANMPLRVSRSALRLSVTEHLNYMETGSF